MLIFPKIADHNDEIIDSFGVKHLFDKNLDTWVKVGFVEVFTDVSEDNDGVVNSSLFNILDNLKPENFIGLKLSNTFNGSQNAYFYYLYSSDGTIKLRFEDIIIPGSSINKHVEVEINKRALIRKLRKLDCVGSKGDTGEDGSAGRDGLPAENEKTFETTVVDNIITIDNVTVNTPIDTDISLRIFKNNAQIVDYRVTTSGDFVSSTVDSSFQVVNDDIKFVDNTLGGTIELNGDLSGDITYKARQVGPKGESGKDGEKFLEINNVFIDDPNLVSTNVVHTLFKLSNDIATLNREIGDNIVATGLVHQDPSNFNFDINNTPMVALLESSNSIKDIVIFNFPGINCPAPDLNFPEWTPTENCPDFRLWNVSNLDWMGEHSDRPWATEEFPFDIKIDPQPAGDFCCKDDFFACPNAGDSPCGTDIRSIGYSFPDTPSPVSEFSDFSLDFSWDDDQSAIPGFDAIDSFYITQLQGSSNQDAIDILNSYNRDDAQAFVQSQTIAQLQESGEILDFCE